MSADRFVTVLGARIRYRMEGRGPHVLLLHGLGASLEFWDWTIPALRERYTAIAADFPGFGQSESLSTAYTPAGAARATLALMDALSVERTALIGFSLGGSIATLAAGTAPARFTAVVLAAPGGFDAGLHPLMRLQTVPWVGEASLLLARRLPRLALRHTFADARRIPGALVDIVRGNATRAATGLSYLSALRKAATVQGVRLDMIYAIRQAAGRITAPTLVVWGDRDGVIPPDQATVAIQTIPNSRLRMIPGAGHLPLIEAATTFNDAVLAFLADVVHPAQVETSP